MNRDSIQGSARRALLASLALLTACQFYDPGLLEPMDAGNGEMCELTRPPPRPTMGDSGGSQELLFGLREVVLNQPRGAWRDIGYDLDGFCRQPPDFPRECDPPSGSEPSRDGNGGIDNRFGADLFPLVNAAVPGIEEMARSAQELGGLPVLRMRGWNGEDDDPRVDVVISQTVYTVAGTSDGPVEHDVESFTPVDPDTGEQIVPQWDTNDHVFLRSDTFVAGDPDQPVIRDDNAYVANRTIVVNLPERVEIFFPADELGVVVRLTGAVATGRLSEDLSTLEDVTVAGRWSIVDLLRTAENIGLCVGTPEYNILRNQLNDIADVRSEASSGSGPGVDCNAISIGVRFTGSRVRFGGVRTGRVLGNLCDEMPDGGMSMMDGGVPSDGG